MTVSSHSATATIMPTVGDPVATEVETMNVTLDETWSPFAQAVMTIPYDAAGLDDLDPRNRPRVRLALEQVFGDSDTIAALTAEGWSSIAAWTAAYTGDSLAAITVDHYRAWNSFGVRSAARRGLDLSVRSRVIDHEAETVSIELASDEALLQDFALLDTTVYAPGITSVRAIVAEVLRRIGAILVTGVADGTITSASATWYPGQSAWDYVSPLVQQAGLRLWCDGKRRWHLETDQWTADGNTVLSSDSSVTRGEDTISRDGDWFDAVVIIYKYTDALGASFTAYDTAAAAASWSKALTLTYDDTPYPGPGAAARVLQRRQAVGRQQEVSAVSDYTAEPSQAVSITLPDTPTQTGFVKRVSWALPDDEMAVESRGLTEISPYAWATALGSWASKSIGVHWATYTP